MAFWAANSSLPTSELQDANKIWPIWKRWEKNRGWEIWPPPMVQYWPVGLLEYLPRMNASGGTSFRRSSLWKGHLLLFDTPRRPDYSDLTGNRLLWVFLIVGFFGRDAARSLGNSVGIGDARWFSLVLILMLTATLLAALFGFARVRFEQLGLRPWSAWSWTERAYAIQVFPAVTLVFGLLFSARLGELWAGRSTAEIVFFSSLPAFLWGFYQEFAYRGLLQTEIVRRTGPIIGILISNSIFAFGPLHFYHFRLAQGDPSHLWIFVAIFGIGLFFSALFHRSGNLWITGIMHGMWPLNFE